MSPTLFDFLQKPFFQISLFLFLTVLVLLVARPKDANAMYNIAGVIYGLFILSNSILVCFIPEVWPYFFYSMLFSVIYLIAAALMLSACTAILKIKGSGESSMVFLIILYHPLALLLLIFCKWAYLKLF